MAPRTLPPSTHSSNLKRRHVAKVKPMTGVLDLADKLQDVADTIPRQAWDGLSRDFSGQIDHYVYGVPKS